MRVSRFLAEQQMTPEQRYLVNYHTEYMLFRDGGGVEPFNAARYTDNRPDEGEAGRDERLVMNARRAIHKLNNQSDFDKATYVRIMGRNRENEERIEDEASIPNQGDDAPGGGDAGVNRAGYGQDDNNPNERLIQK